VIKLRVALFLFPPPLDKPTTKPYHNTVLMDAKTKEHFRRLLDYSIGVICSVCRVKVLDPDKVKNQVYLRGTCPTCGKESGEKHKPQQVHHSGNGVRNMSKSAQRRARKAEMKEWKRMLREEADTLRAQSLQ
jgi:hypothetical protein